MKERIAMALLLALAATSASAQSRRGGGGGGHPSGGGHFSRGFAGGGRGMSGGSGWGGGYARPRGGPPTGAQLRHPRAGTGSYYYGHGYGRYGHGYGHYPYYGHSYGYYPYYGGYGYYPYAYGYPAFSLGLGFYYGGGGGQPATVYGDVPGDEPYGGGGGPDEAYDRGEGPRGPDESAELRLDVQPDDASIYVDDQFRGIARRAGSLRVTPGRHRVEVVRPGFRVAEQRIEVAPGAATTVHIELERR